MDKKIEDLVKRVINDDLMLLVTDVIKACILPIYKLVEQIQTTFSLMSKQVNDDRQDIADIKTNQATIIAQQKVIIDALNHRETKMVEAVKEATKKIPQNVETAVGQVIQKKPFMKRMLDNFQKR